MSSGFFHFKHGTALMAMTLLLGVPGVLSAADEARPRGRPIEFSEIEGESAGTNVFKSRSPRVTRLDFLDPSTKADRIDFQGSPQVFVPVSSPKSTLQKKSRRSKDDSESNSSDEVIRRFIAKEILKIPEAELEADERLASLLDGGWDPRDMTGTNSPVGLGSTRSKPDRSESRAGWGDGQQAIQPGRSESPLSDARSSLRALVADSPGFDTAASRPLTLSDMFAPKKNPDAQLEAARYHQVQQIQLETFRKMLATAPSAQASEPLSRPAMPSASSLAPTAPWAPMTAPPAFNQGFPTAPANGGGISFPGAAGAAPAPPSPPPSKLTPPQPIFSVPQRRF